MTAVLYKNPIEYSKLLNQFELSGMERKRVSELSGGQRQKLSIILALINNPQIVFLDELTTGLDPGARREIWQFLKQLQSRGLTVFLTSHYMDEVDYLCDKIMILDHGKTVAEGTPQEVKSVSGKKSMEECYLHFIGKEVKNETFIYTV